MTFFIAAVYPAPRPHSTMREQRERALYRLIAKGVPVERAHAAKRARTEQRNVAAIVQVIKHGPRYL